MNRGVGLAERTLSAGLAAVVLAVATCGLEAQPPERPQEVEVPGLGIMLRAGWQLLFHEGCRFAVPTSWRPDADEAFARGPDGSSVSIQMLRITDWSAYKAGIRSANARAKVHEESGRRLWLETSEGPWLQHYIAAADGASVCTCWLEMHAGGASATKEIIQRIADSIGLAPENWPPEDK
jgi:hypothetical protein